MKIYNVIHNPNNPIPEITFIKDVKHTNNRKNNNNSTGDSNDDDSSKSGSILRSTQGVEYSTNYTRFPRIQRFRDFFRRD